MISFDSIANYMRDDLREQVHAELAPCPPKEFLRRYLELDPSFQGLLDSEFSEAYLEAALLDREYFSRTPTRFTHSAFPNTEW